MSTKTRQELFLELIKAIRDNQSANQKLDFAFCKTLGINQTDGRCFDVLDHHGPMTAGHLAAAVGLTSGAVTAVIDRLAAKGFAERLDDPTDRRRVLVGITEAGSQRAAQYYGPMAQRGAEEFKSLSAAEVELLIDFHRRSTIIQNETADAALQQVTDS